jgi:hypothetical protein
VKSSHCPTHHLLQVMKMRHLLHNYNHQWYENMHYNKLTITFISSQKKCHKMCHNIDKKCHTNLNMTFQNPWRWVLFFCVQNFHLYFIFLQKNRARSAKSYNKFYLYYLIRLCLFINELNLSKFLNC